MFMDSIHKDNDFYTLSSFGNVFICNDNISDSKTITFPVGYNLDSNLSFKILFAKGHNCANSSTHLTLNDIPVVINKHGNLIPIPNHAMQERSSTVYKCLQPNTMLEMYYNSNYDGEGNSAFVVVGNPTVLSSTNYTIYADGQSSLDLVLPINSVYVQFPNQSSPNDLWGKISQWTELNYDGAFFRASGTNANAFNGGIQGDLVKNHVHNMNHIHDRGNMEIYGSIGSVVSANAAIEASPSFSSTYHWDSTGRCGNGGWTLHGNSIDFYASRTWSGYTGGTRNPDYNNAFDKPNTEGNDPYGIENRPINYTIKIWKRTK